MSDIWIPMLVRQEHATQVLDLVLHLEAARGMNPDEPVIVTAPSPQAGSTDELKAWPAWSVDDLRRLATGSTLTTARWAKAMDVCAEHPGRYFPTDEVAELSDGMTVKEWRHAPKKMSAHLRTHYPDVPRDPKGHLAWPLHAKTLPEHPGQVSWAMNSEMADRWKEARRG